MQVFADRREAGRQLAGAVRQVLGDESAVVVLAIPRGGLPVGVEVAAELGADLDVAVVRKLRSPHNLEVGFGAVGPNGFVEVDRELVERLGLSEEQVSDEIEDRRQEVRRRLAMYRTAVPAKDLTGKIAVVVDDGIATGGTARQACAMARTTGARRVVLASPVAPTDAADRLADVADEVVILSSPAEFLGVGQAYQTFEQMDDDAALAVLGGAGVAD
jgi:putative phosphoribosyl transferase